jgi:hypothetical protein
MRILSLLLAFAVGFAASSPPVPAGGQIVLPQPCSPASWTARSIRHACRDHVVVWNERGLPLEGLFPLGADI